MATEAKLDRSADPGVHGAVLTKYEVARIREALKYLTEEHAKECAADLGYAGMFGALVGACTNARETINSVLNCADLATAPTADEEPEVSF